jgi:hypothetical protein
MSYRRDRVQADEPLPPAPPRRGRDGRKQTRDRGKPPHRRDFDLGLAKNFIDLRNHGPWQVGAERIGELNKHLRGSVAVVARRNETD